MLKLDFFVENNTKDSDEIKKMVKSLDDKKCSYKVYDLSQQHVNGKHWPILKMTLETGEVLEYDKDNMFKVIVDLSKVEISK